jgi:hypothetical protein
MADAIASAGINWYLWSAGTIRPGLFGNVS